MDLYNKLQGEALRLAINSIGQNKYMDGRYTQNELDCATQEWYNQLIAEEIEKIQTRFPLAR